MRWRLAYTVIVRSRFGAVHPTFGSHRVVNLGKVTEHNQDRYRFSGATPRWKDKSLRMNRVAGLSWPRAR
jgi:hypothetical protein